MDHFHLSLYVIIVLIFGIHASEAYETSFAQNYEHMFGILIDQGKEVQLIMDHTSGAGFHSKQDFGSGYFRMKMKLPNKNSKGVITAFYLTSKAVGDSKEPHDELDFEFLGNDIGKPYTLSTNIFASDSAISGHREQTFHLWFDPTADFHTYAVYWNQHQIVFLVDEIPIRVFKNNSNIGVNYPSKSMHIEASIWNDTAWTGEVNWSQEPFTAYYSGFSIDGCKYDGSNPQACYASSPTYYWNAKQYWQLSPDQQRKYFTVRKKYMISNYCLTNPTQFRECQKHT